jgi:EmrB/QacA subfamily drug resistance transporter
MSRPSRAQYLTGWATRNHLLPSEQVNCTDAPARGSAVINPCDSVAISEVAPCLEAAERTRGRWILAACILGSSLAFIDGTVVNVALPAMQSALDASISDLQWVVESYALFLAALLLVGGSLGDIYGRRRIFVAGIAIFAAASAWCGFAANVQQLIVARAVQGAGAALLVPGSLAIISAAFPEKDRGRAIGTWSGFTGITTAVGPVLGGWLVQHLSWRWVFFINLPIAAAVIAISLVHVPESRAESAAHKLDVIGAFLITAGLGSLIYGLIEAPNLGWMSPLVWGSLAGAVVLIAGFLLWEIRRAAPLLPLDLFRSRNFSGANLLTLFLYAALGAVLFFLPFNLIQVQGYTPTQAGAANLPFIVILFLLSSWSGGLVTRYGPRLPLALGSLVAGAGFLLFARPGVGGSYWNTFFPATVVLGLGMSGVVAPLTTTVMNSVGREQAGLASGVNNAVSRIASLLAIAVFGIVALHTFSSGLNKNLVQAGLPDSATARMEEQQSRLTQIQIPDELTHAQQEAAKAGINRAFIGAFRRIMFLSAILAGLSGAIAWKFLDAETTAKAVREPNRFKKMS